MKSSIVCFGEILWDIFPNYKQLGGAPFNVTYHLQKWGTASNIISRIGEDSLGKDILDSAQKLGISTEFIQIDSEHPTGTVQVQLDDAGSPQYQIKEGVAFDHIELTNGLISIVKNSDAFIFGSLICRNEVSKNTLFKLLKHSKKNILDLNLRQSYHSKKLVIQLLDYTHILKINSEEFDYLSGIFLVPESELYAHLTEEFSIDVIVQTKGVQGAEVYANDELIQQHAYPADVVDTVGSGDGFLGAFVHALLQEIPLEQCLDLASRMGAYITTQKGATPEYHPSDISDHARST